MILDPFPDVPMHVVQTKSIVLERADGCRLLVAAWARVAVGAKITPRVKGGHESVFSTWRQTRPIVLGVDAAAIFWLASGQQAHLNRLPVSGA